MDTPSAESRSIRVHGQLQTGSEGPSSRPKPALALLCLLLWAIVPLPAALPPRSVVPETNVVEDEFIGYLFALVHDDLAVDARGDELMELFPEYLGGEQTPMDFIIRFERAMLREGGYVRLTFQRAFTHPAPIDIMGHRPVTLSSSGVLEFTERNPAGDTGSRGRVSRAHVLARSEGEFSVDFAGWLDFLLGSLVDDVAVEIVLAAEFEGRWYGAMAGYSPRGRVVTSVYDMRRGRFLARPPRALSRFAMDQLEQPLEKPLQ